MVFYTNDIITNTNWFTVEIAIYLKDKNKWNDPHNSFIYLFENMRIASEASAPTSRCYNAHF